MKIEITDRQREMKISKLSVKSLVKAVLDIYEIRCSLISIFFIREKETCSLHEQFFQDPSITDCMTFPMDDPYEEPCEMLGEIFVCPQVARDYALSHQSDPYKELSLYVVHGILHLLGYDDLTPKDRVKMRKEEKRCLDHLSKHSLLIKSPNNIEKK